MSKLVLDSADAIDLQLHTTYSDGVWTPEALLDHLVQEQFGLAAITDHDRADTAFALQALAQEKQLPVLVAVEMSTVWQNDLSGRDEMTGLPNMTDLLCFGFEPGPNALNDLAQDLLRRQSENTREVFENLQRQGYLFSEEVDELMMLLERPSVQQPYALADLLKKYSYGDKERSAPRIVLDAGCKFILNDLAEVVEAAHDSGALCLIAHPGRKDGFVTYDAHKLDKLREEIPIDGLEIYYPLHTAAQTEMFQAYAQRHQLLMSAGSDSHGPDKPPIKYSAELSRTLLERLGVQLVN